MAIAVEASYVASGRLVRVAVEAFGRPVLGVGVGRPFRLGVVSLDRGDDTGVFADGQQPTPESLSSRIVNCFAQIVYDSEFFLVRVISTGVPAIPEADCPG